ncbi:MAG: ATP-dependent 6-phosphofructokinase [bacterium]|nr:ATP-dependent 6-phosphofructokinase [bacterium]
MSNIKKIGILTRDCAGVNAAIRAIVRTACAYDMETVGIMRGYEGLINNEIIPLSSRSVSGIINLGGTILKTSRSKTFCNSEGRAQAARNVKANGIDGLIVVGGNGSLTGANLLAVEHNIPVIGVPTTIDNDINGVDNAIGADTAINVAIDALDKIRDTAVSLERIFVVEVMGRNCGYIASKVALAGGCEEVLLPERDFNMDNLCEDIEKASKKGKVSWIIITAEGKAKALDIVQTIKEKTGFDIRAVVLGHIQRGGRPTAFDRVLAAYYGNFAVELFRKGEINKCMRLEKNNTMVSFPLEEAIKPKNIEVEKCYGLIKMLAG